MTINLNLYGFLSIIIIAISAITLIVVVIKHISKNKKNLKITKNGIEISNKENKCAIAIGYIIQLNNELNYIKLKSMKKKQVEKAESILQEMIDEINTLFLDFFEKKIINNQDKNINSSKLKSIALLTDIILEKMKSRIKLSIDINHFSQRNGVEWEDYVDSKVKLNIDIIINTLKSNIDIEYKSIVDDFLSTKGTLIKSSVDKKTTALYIEMKKIALEDEKRIEVLKKQIEDNVKIVGSTE